MDEIRRRIDRGADRPRDFGDTVRPLTRFGYLGGGLLTTVGVLGLAVTGLADPLAPHGQYLLVFETNTAQNLLQVLIGLWMVIGAAGSEHSARTSALATSAALGMLGLVGLALAGPTGNPLALNVWDNGLHLLLALWGAVVILADGRRTPTLEQVTSP